MSIMLGSVGLIAGVISLIFGIIIVVFPKILNYLVGIYLITVPVVAFITYFV